jgi:protease IV
MAERKENQWERNVIEKIASDSLSEQRKTRRWGIFFKLLTLFYLSIILIFVITSGRSQVPSSGEFSALIKINGVIGTGLDVSAEDVISSLKDAYSYSGTKAIILEINSPGGSPVQSGMINDEIRRGQQMYPDIPVYAVVQDICASGGYYIAVAADKIFVDKASIVGSIGVRIDGFGFEEIIKKIGVERRLITSGENKGILDPFLPVPPKQSVFIKQLLDEVHKQFIDVVKQGRGDKLSMNPDIFSGLFWNGDRAITLGLVDDFGTVDSVARDIVKNEEIVDFTIYDSFGDTLAEKIGVGIGGSIGNSFMNKIKENIVIK